MAILKILEFPDPRLRRVARPVTVFDDELGELIDSMLETMYQADGIGLAATQVDVHRRVLVLDVSGDRDSPRAFVNPRLEVLDEAPAEYEEGCLSVPGFSETVSRPAGVRVTAEDRRGETFRLDAGGLLATCVQHEVDHLDGKLFVDRISPLKRRRIREKLEKERRRSA